MEIEDARLILSGEWGGWIVVEPGEDNGEILMWRGGKLGDPNRDYREATIDSNDIQFMIRSLAEKTIMEGNDAD